MYGAACVGIGKERRATVVVCGTHEVERERERKCVCMREIQRERSK